MIYTLRLELKPITLDMVRAVFDGDRARLSVLCGADLPEPWPGRNLVEQAFCASLEEIERDPELRLWGDRMAFLRQADGEKLSIVGSVIFHGKPGPDGVVEVAYGIEQSSQRKGFATEALGAQVDWALRQPSVKSVKAQTLPWHLASRRVLEKVGFQKAGAECHEFLGEVIFYERHKNADMAGS